MVPWGITGAAMLGKETERVAKINTDRWYCSSPIIFYDSVLNLKVHYGKLSPCANLNLRTSRLKSVLSYRVLQ